jgi:hypothetical protein
MTGQKMRGTEPQGPCFSSQASPRIKGSEAIAPKTCHSVRKRMTETILDAFVQISATCGFVCVVGLLAGVQGGLVLVPGLSCTKSNFPVAESEIVSEKRSTKQGSHVDLGRIFSRSCPAGAIHLALVISLHGLLHLTFSCTAPRPFTAIINSTSSTFT